MIALVGLALFLAMVCGSKLRSPRLRPVAVRR